MIKRIIASVLCVIILCMVFCGCSSNETANTDVKENESLATADNGDKQETDDKTTSTGEITMEALMAAPESPVEDFVVVDYGEPGIYLEEYLGNDEIVVIPESLGITKIAKYTFANDCCVKAIRLSDSIQILDEHSFGLNENLQLFVCGNGLVEIGDVVFQNCTNLRELVLNDGLVKMGKYSVGGCSSLLSLYIPATVTEFGNKPFYGKAEGFTIIGEAGSVAEQHAAEWNIPFKASQLLGY